MQATQKIVNIPSQQKKKGGKNVSCNHQQHKSTPLWEEKIPILPRERKTCIRTRTAMYRRWQRSFLVQKRIRIQQQLKKVIIISSQQRNIKSRDPGTIKLRIFSPSIVHLSLSSSSWLGWHYHTTPLTPFDTQHLQ